jgi:hypothetical protein
VAPPIEIRTKTALSVPIRFAHEPPPDSGRGRRGPACALGTIGDWSAPTAGDSNRRSGLAITQFAGRVMADTIVAKKAGPDSKVAITPAHFYLFPHRVEAKGPTVPAVARRTQKEKPGGDGGEARRGLGQMTRTHSLPRERWGENRPPKGKGGQVSEAGAVISGDSMTANQP